MMKAVTLAMSAALTEVDQAIIPLVVFGDPSLMMLKTSMGFPP